jgi:tRNA threonylcarbamoyladenosine biosynthesis protein TsaB
MNWLLTLVAQRAWCSVAIDPLSSVALGQPRECWSELSGADQSQSLLRLVDGLLASRGIARDDLAAIACDAGPGAFTALRISCSIGQGIALGLGLPLVPIGTLEALAVQVARPQGPGRHRVLVVCDARMNELYSAEFEVTLGSEFKDLHLRELRAPAVCLPEVLVDRVAAGPACADPIVLGGDGQLACPDLLEQLTRRAVPVLQGAEPGHALTADVVALLAARRLAEGGDFDPALAAPLYVRDKVALDLGEQQALRAARLRSA